MGTHQLIKIFDGPSLSYHLLDRGKFRDDGFDYEMILCGIVVAVSSRKV